MSDLIKRLREAGAFYGITRPLLNEAADEIERLQAQNADLTKKLEAGWIQVTQTILGEENMRLQRENDELRESTRAAVEAFKKRCVEVCINKAKSVTQLNFAGGCEWCAEAIESLSMEEE